MSKKPAPAAAADVHAQPANSTSPAATVVVVPQELVDEAWTRFKPFVFTLSTENRENVDFGVVVAQLQRDQVIGPNLVVVDRADAVQAVAAANPLATADSSFGQVVGDAKANLALLGAPEGPATFTSDQSNLVAQCVRFKISQAAIAREQSRREEQRIVHQQHLELVERYIEEGMKPQEAERAALEEEQAAARQAAAGAGVDDDAGAVERPQAFVLLRGFPLSPQDLTSLAKVNVPVHAVLSVNTLARFGIKKDDLSAAGAADGKTGAAQKGGVGGKKANAPEPKKVDPKKSGGKGADAVVATATVDPLAVALKKEHAKLPRLSPSHPFLQCDIWTYQLPTHETQLVDEATGLKIHELALPEVQCAQVIVDRVVQLEQYCDRYSEWLAARTLRTVKKLQTREDQAAAAAAALAAAQEAKAAAELAKASAAPPAKKGGKAPPAAKAGTSTVVDDGAKDGDLGISLINMQAITLAKNMQDIAYPSDVYRGVLHVLPEQKLSDPSMMLDAITAQVAVSAAAAAKSGQSPVEPRSAINTPRQGQRTPRGGQKEEDAVLQLKRDVADFADFVLAQLDGNQKDVFEAARTRRLHPSTTASDVISITNRQSEEAIKVSAPLCETPAVAVLPPVEGGHLRSEEISAVLSNLRKAEGVSAQHSDQSHDSSTLESIARACQEAIARSTGNGSGTAAAVDQPTHWEVLNEEQFAARVEATLLSPDGAPRRDITTLGDGSEIIVLHQSNQQQQVNSDAATVTTAADNGSSRRRWNSSWTVLHGLPSFGQWLRVAEFADKETLHYFPPPRDDDDEDEEQQAAAGGGADAADEEEEEEEEEEIEDENGDVVVKKIKKEKEKKKYEPEYVDFTQKETEERRRRNCLAHISRLLEVPAEEVEVLYANNHTASGVYAEDHVMTPDDGSIIVCSDVAVNTHGVNCTVRALGNALFGFRGSRQPSSAGGPVSAVIGSGVRSFLSIEDGGFCVTAEVSVRRKNGDGLSGTIASIATPRDNAMTPANNVVFVADDYTTVTTVVAGTHDCSVTVDDGANSLTLTRPSERQAALNKILQYSSPANDAELTLVGKELHRSVLPSGTMVVHYENGSILYLAEDGAWASSSSAANGGTWLHCNARGQRLLRLGSSGHVRELAPSLTSTRRDPSSGACITERSDGTTRVDFADGLTSVVKHHNGTTYWHYPNRRLEIVSQGYPRIVLQRDGRDEAEQVTAVFPKPSCAFFSWTPHRRVVVGHEPTALQALIAFDTLRMHVVPSPERSNEYVIDMAFGGLRSADQSHAFHVTPLGRTRCRRLEDENPDPPTDLTIKHVIDVFVTQREIISHDFTDAMKALGHMAFGNSLHLAPKTTPADPEQWINTVSWSLNGGATGGNSSLLQKEKAQRTALGLAKLLFQTSTKGGRVATVQAPRVFVRLPNGQGVLEARSAMELQLDVRRVLQTGDLVRSHVRSTQLGKSSWSAIAVCIADSDSPLGKPTRKQAGDELLDDLLSTHQPTSFSTVAEFALALQQRTNNPEADSACARPPLLGRLFIVKDSNGSSSPALSTMDVFSAVEPSFSAAVSELASTLPPSLRNPESLADTQLPLPKTVLATKPPSSTWSTKASALTQLRQQVDSVQPAAPNFWTHAVTSSGGSEPCLDLERERNEALKQQLRKEKEEKARQVQEADERKRHPVYPPRKPTAGNELQTVERAEPQCEQEDQQALVPAFVPLHVNPAGTEMQSQRFYHSSAPDKSSLAGSKKQHALSRPRLASTPTEVEFGTLMEGFRYMTVLQLTNISAVCSRFRVVVSGESLAIAEKSATQELRHSCKSSSTCCPWLSVEYPRVGLAPGMSCSIEIEVDGHQPVGDMSLKLSILFDGGSTEVPLHVATRSGSERPVSQQRSNVRMIGPSPLIYTPGATATRGKGQSGASGRGLGDDGNDSD